MSEEALGHVCPPSVIKWLNSPLRKLIQSPRKIMGKYVKPGDTAVDLGCGGGFFAVELARMVGDSGRVIAVDLQQEMREFTRRLAVKKGVMERITLHQCQEKDIGLSDEKVDFALAFYMVHEVPDRDRFLKQVVELLNPEARFMLIEPSHHVKPEEFKLILEEAAIAGLKQVEPIKRAMSRGMLFSLKL